MSSEETLAWARGTGTGVSEGLSCSPGPIFPGLFVRSSELSAGSGGKTGSTPLAGRGSGWRCPSRWPRAAPVGAEAGSLTWPRGRLLCRSAPLGAGSCKGVARVEGPGAFPLFPSPVQSCCLPPLQPGVVPCSLFPPSLTGEPSGAALGPAAPSETASPRPGSELRVPRWLGAAPRGSAPAHPLEAVAKPSSPCQRATDQISACCKNCIFVVTDLFSNVPCPSLPGEPVPPAPRLRVWSVLFGREGSFGFGRLDGLFLWFFLTNEGTLISWSLSRGLCLPVSVSRLPSLRRPRGLGLARKNQGVRFLRCANVLAGALWGALGRPGGRARRLLG